MYETIQSPSLWEGTYFLGKGNVINQHGGPATGIHRSRTMIGFVTGVKEDRYTSKALCLSIVDPD